jgi:hypothetical protein
MDRWTAREVAAAARVAPQSARDLVRKLGLKAVSRDLDSGAKLYDANQAAAALAARPGRGARTDLGHAARPLTADERARVSEWEAAGEQARTLAAECGDEYARAMMKSVADASRTLRLAANWRPLYAMNPNLDDPHRKVYDVAAELAQQIMTLARGVDRGGIPERWAEVEAMRNRLSGLAYLALGGRPLTNASSRGSQS